MSPDNTQHKQSYILKIQKLGRLLSGMIMPNIGVYIAWGLLTALFIPGGWLPNASLARLVDPIITYLLPILIGYTGGKLLYGHRGGVLGAMATMGAVVGTNMPMIFGAMVTGPIAAWVIKKFDDVFIPRVPAGFEMLLNNFSGGILGGVMTVCAYLGIGPVVEYFALQLGLLVQLVVDAEALPLAALVIEPAKVMFLNNAVNHGVLGPLGVQQATETGASILFLLEANPGPGLGILLTYFVFHRGTVKQSAPGAMLIHFFGGIHEVYFPYVLMQPRLLLAVMGGGAAGILVFSLLGAGLVAVPSPGSILTVMAMTPKGGLFAVLAGVFASTLVSFALGALLINRKATAEQEELTQAKEKLTALKGVKTLLGHDCIPDDLKEVATLRLIAVACDAGMGSSAMGASKLRAALAEAGAKLKVISCSVDQLASPVELVISHERLTERAIKTLPAAVHIAVTNFITTPVYEELANQIVFEQHRCRPEPASSNEHEGERGEGILKKQNIKLGLGSMSKEQAIKLAGSLLYEGGYVAAGYIAGMLERESDFSTYIGNGAAIPHGSSAAREYIKRTGLCILQFPEGIDFDGNTVYLLVAIAALGDQHLEVLAELAKTIEDASAMERLRTTSDIDTVYRQFSTSATPVT